MDENYECDFYITEEQTLKKCSNVEIQKILKKELGRGQNGVIYPVIVKFGSKEITLVIKKISKQISTKKEEKLFIEDMYNEVDYSYEMGKNEIGPHVYDAFFYKNGNTLYQYILMEKFDTSVSEWILSESSLLTNRNCTFVTDQMLDILYKQIFNLNTFCGDIKTDNFVINFNPFIVKMIDFGIDWCDNVKLPNAYSKIKSLKNKSLQVKKELFYCMCTLQLFMNIINIGTPLKIIKMMLKPFYTDAIFIKYVLKNELQNKLVFKKVEKNEKVNFKLILKDMLDYKYDQAILLSHYIKRDKYQMDNEEIVNFALTKIKEMATFIFKKELNTN